MTIALALILHPLDGTVLDGTVLIAQRPSNVHLADLWEFPGGKCLPKETPKECAVREAREETGLQVDVIEAWEAITYTYPDRTVTLHPFLCRAVSGEAQPFGSRQVRWASLEELVQYPFPEANKGLLERLQQVLGTEYAIFTG